MSSFLVVSYGDIYEPSYNLVGFFLPSFSSIIASSFPLVIPTGVSSGKKPFGKKKTLRGSVDDLSVILSLSLSVSLFYLFLSIFDFGPRRPRSVSSSVPARGQPARPTIERVINFSIWESDLLRFPKYFRRELSLYLQRCGGWKERRCWLPWKKVRVKFCFGQFDSFGGRERWIRSDPTTEEEKQEGPTLKTACGGGKQGPKWLPRMSKALSLPPARGSWKKGKPYFFGNRR